MSLKDLKERILSENRLTTVVEHFIPLTRKGTTTLAVCPFHDDRHPSMHVTDDKKMFKCFSCGAGGNAIDFVMKYKNIDFVEALKNISGLLAINFDDYSTKKNKPPKLIMAERILNFSLQLYRKAALSKKFAPYDEFIKNRGLSFETAELFHLGYAPKDSELSKTLKTIIKDPKEREFAISVALEIGIIKVDQKNLSSHYDTFRERIMFPIWDQYGQIVGYTSRAVFDYQKAKYMNSKESFVFNKKHILYGLHLAKKSIKSSDAVILVEGNMDQIALTNKGFTNAVAVQGIALGEQPLRNLKAMTTNFYLGLDSDDAGLKASIRINRQCLEAGITPKYLDFAPHKDPDDFLKNEGSIALQKMLDEAPAFIDEELRRAMPEVFPELLDQQLALLRVCFEIVSPLKDGLMATERLATMAKKIGLKSDSAQITNNYKEFLKESPATPNFSSAPAPHLEEVPEGLMTESFHQEEEYYFAGEMELENQQQMSRIDSVLVQELVQHPNCLSHDKITELLDFIGNDEVKNYILKVKDLFFEIDEDEYVAVLKNYTENSNLSSALKENVYTALDKYRSYPSDKKIIAKLLFDIEKKLKEEKLKEKRDELTILKNTCSIQSEVDQYLTEIGKVSLEITKLKTLKQKK